ncbi:MAG: hypothetical protein PHW62_00530 [Candidatus Ratteibacteria bacterium]|nr:hypothetical protein [Candidatus Ratteibacteria bacterium]
MVIENTKTTLARYQRYEISDKLETLVACCNTLRKRPIPIS